MVPANGIYGLSERETMLEICSEYNGDTRQLSVVHPRLGVAEAEQ